MSEQRDQHGGDRFDDAAQPTRAYDTGAFSAGFDDADRAQHRTAEIDVTRPIQRAEPPSYAPATGLVGPVQPVEQPTAAPWAPPAAAPAPDPLPGAPIDRDLRVGWSGDPAVDALARLEHEARGPRPWARVLSAVLSLLAIAPIVWLIHDLRGVQMFESVVVQVLAGDLGLGTELSGVLVSGSVAVLLVVIGLCTGLSGLGPGVAGLAAIVAGAALWFVHGTQYSAGMAMSLAGAAFLVINGALLLAVGIGAHFARRGGYGRALRIVRDAHRLR